LFGEAWREDFGPAHTEKRDNLLNWSGSVIEGLPGNVDEHNIDHKDLSGAGHPLTNSEREMAHLLCNLQEGQV
jgi:hypothetical protein